MNSTALWNRAFVRNGAQLGFVVGPVAGLTSYLAVPTQGIEQTPTRHKLALEPVRGVAKGPLASQTIGIHVGSRFPAFDIR